MIVLKFALKGNRLKIVDRLKHIFKLSQGEYVAPEKLEQIYSQTSLVTQVFVDGSSLRSYPVALVVPDGDALCKALNLEHELDSGGRGVRKASKHSNNRNVGGDITDTTEKFRLKDRMVTLADLCSNPDAERLIHSELIQLGRTAALKGFEQV